MKYFSPIIIACYLLINLNLNAQEPIKFMHAYGPFPFNFGMCVHQETDTGYVILSNVSGLMGSNNVQLFKIDKNGAYVWDKLYSDSALFWAEKMVKTPDNGFLISGYTNKNNLNAYDVFLYKTDSVGNLQWQRTYGGCDWDFGLNVAVDNNGNYFVCGSTYSFGNGHTDMYMLKVNPQGDTLWTRTFGGVYEDVATSVDVCENGDIIVAGYTKSMGQGDFDAILLRYSNDGDYLFHKTYGGPECEKIYAVYELYNNDIVMGGHTASFGNGGDDYYFIYTDPLGAEQWYRTAGGNAYERSFCMNLTADSGYVLSGETVGPGYYDIYFYKMLPDGYWHYSTGHGSLDQQKAYASHILHTLDGGYIIVGTTYGFGSGLCNIYVIKTGIDGLTEPYNNINEHFPDSYKALNIYPNPANSLARIQISNPSSENTVFKLYNALGKLVFLENLEPALRNFDIHTDYLAPDIYYYMWQNKNNILHSGKIIIAR